MSCAFCLGLYLGGHHKLNPGDCFFCLAPFLLGPGANLGWGSEVLGLHIVETLLFFSAIVLFVRARRPELRVLLAITAIVVWVVSGIIPVAAAF